MLTDLLANNRLIGAERNKIIEMLGEPDFKNMRSDDDYVYWLGPERGFISIDSELLILKFKSGKVSDVLIGTD